jgi:hypothetical protein
MDAPVRRIEANDIEADDGRIVGIFHPMLLQKGRWETLAKARVATL